METKLSLKEKTVTVSPDHPFVMIGERINPTRLACDLLMGRDEYCGSWIKSFRAREKAKTIVTP